MTAGHWSEGYATGAAYTHHYFDDLNPLRAAFVLLLEGLDGPPPGPCCELGFGQGVSLAMHAAADPTRRWWGNDFMPEHAAQAQCMVDAAGVDAMISDQSFEEFCARKDLPRFAFVGLHGVWSWISAANRARIADFLHDHLLPGAVVYISYNTLAGWGAMLPLRELMLQHFQRASPPGRSAVARAKDALSFAQQVLALKPALAGAAPVLESMIADLASKSPAYLLHELLNENWHPMSFAQLHAELGPARLSFAGISDLHFRFTDIHVTKPQQEALAQIEDDALRESTLDALMARRFRRDYWVRGRRALSRTEAMQRLRAQCVLPAMVAREVPTHVQGTIGSTVMAAERLTDIFGLLEQAGGPVELGRLLDHAAARGLGPNEALDLVTALVGMRAIHLVTGAAQREAARPFTRRLNAYLTGPHAQRADIVYLASPASGGGIAAPAALQLLLAARSAAPDDPESWPARVWDAMQAEGQQLMKGQQRVTDRATAVATLQPLVKQMQEQNLPHLLRLGVVD